MKRNLFEDKSGSTLFKHFNRLLSGLRNYFWSKDQWKWFHWTFDKLFNHSGACPEQKNYQLFTTGIQRVREREFKSLFNILDTPTERYSHRLFLLFFFPAGNNEEHFHSSLDRWMRNQRPDVPAQDGFIRLARHSQGVSSPFLSTPRGAASLISDLLAGAATCHSGVHAHFPSLWNDARRKNDPRTFSNVRCAFSSESQPTTDFHNSELPAD